MLYLIITVLVILSGIFSGLNLGFFSISKDDLQRKAELGSKRAKKVYELRKHGNLLLSTLLVGNVLVNSTLAIFLSSITTGLWAGVISTALIVVFGEIVPQATFSRFALKLGSKFSWLVKIFMYILLPVCYPLAWTLDKILGGEEPTIYSKKEILKLISQHENLKESDIDEDEEKIVHGALSYSQKKVKEVMTEKEDVFYLNANDLLDQETVKKIKDDGSSRIPIIEDSKVVGLLYVKDIIDPLLQNKKLKELAREKVNFVSIATPLDEVLNKFRRTRSHLFIVLNNAKHFAGIITIEDIIEEIIGKEIMDEYDEPNS